MGGFRYNRPSVAKAVSAEKATPVTSGLNFIQALSHLKAGVAYTWRESEGLLVRYGLNEDGTLCQYSFVDRKINPEVMHVDDLLATDWKVSP